jgi:hypothetical protein
MISWMLSVTTLGFNLVFGGPYLNLSLKFIPRLIFNIIQFGYFGILDLFFIQEDIRDMRCTS